jgi:hypothetical protein
VVMRKVTYSPKKEDMMAILSIYGKAVVPGFEGFKRSVSRNVCSGCSKGEIRCISRSQVR